MYQIRILMRVIEHTDCVYLDEPLLYYDGGHGAVIILDKLVIL